MKPEIHFHENDLPKSVKLGDCVAIDTETMGLEHRRDRLCLVQLSAGDGECHLVRIAPDQDSAPNIEKILTDGSVLKLFHFARFDIAALFVGLGALTNNVYCTKIASKLCRTYTDRHGLRDLCKELLKVEISKEQQQTYWGAKTFTEAQMIYAATDVLYLHQLKEILDERLEELERLELAYSCFDFLHLRSYLDTSGFSGWNIFEH